MRIEAVEPVLVNARSRNWVFVKITTNSGIFGIGEATLEGRSLTVSTAIQEMARYLRGKDPSEIERHYQCIYRGQFWKGGPVLISALSGIEQALWDILGKSVNRPVYALLGGRVRDRIMLYANGWIGEADTIDGVVAKARRVVEKGFRAIKLPGFGVHMSLSGKTSYRWAVDCAHAVREAVGADIELMVDLHGRTTPAEAIALARDYEDIGLYFLEEPTSPENIPAMAEIKQHSGLRIATGERLFTCYAFRELLERRAADILQPDLCHCGGILQARKIAAMAEASYALVSPHNPNGPVSTAACIQFATCTHNFDMLEYFVEDVPWREEVFPNVFDIHDGYLIPSSRPGLGIEWDEAAARRHPYTEVDLPVCHLADGTVAEW